METAITMGADSVTAVRKEAERLYLEVERISPIDERDRVAKGILTVRKKQRAVTFYIFDNTIYSVKVDRCDVSDADLKTEEEAIRLVRWVSEAE